MSVSWLVEALGIEANREGCKNELDCEDMDLVLVKKAHHIRFRWSYFIVACNIQNIPNVSHPACETVSMRCRTRPP